MLKEGELIIFPTDTVYGLGCRLFDQKGLENIYKVKKRDIGKQIPVLIYDLVSVADLCKYSERDIKIMKHFWPGALTLVFNSTDYFYKKTGLKTIAVRIPNHYMALRLINEYGPLWTTSCNISNQEPLSDPKKIKETFGMDIANIYTENVNEASFKSSTVLDLTGDEIKVLRQGDITLQQILKVI